MFYVKALDTAGEERTLESQKTNKQHPTSVYNYQLHPFLWDELGLWVRDHFSCVEKKEKRHERFIDRKFCLLLQPKARLLSLSVSPRFFLMPEPEG